MDKELDIVVVGGGPAGLSAALAARELGAPVTVIDAYGAPGGQYYRQPPAALAGQPTRHQREGRALWQKALAAGVEIVAETQVWSGSASRELAVCDASGSWTVQAQAVILATGTYERPVAFPGWTLPGVLMTGGAQTLLQQGVLPGRRVLLAGSGPLQLIVAQHLLEAGAEVAAVLEGASGLAGRGLRHLGGAWGQWERLGEGARALAALVRHRVPYRTGWGIAAARGASEVEGATMARYDREWRPIPGSEVEIKCDTVCIGYGFVPFTSLGRVMGAEHAWDPATGAEIPVRDGHFQTSLAGVWAVGDGAGVGGVRLARLEGKTAGLAAAAELGYGTVQAERQLEELAPQLRRERAFQRMYTQLFTPGPGLGELADEETIVCRCEGVTLGQVRRAVERGATSFTEMKAITRTGMGECQGRMCGRQVAQEMARMSGQTAEAVGTNPARPPVFPLPLSALVFKDE